GAVASSLPLPGRNFTALTLVLLCSRFPLVYGLPLVPEGVTEPGINRVRAVKLRPGRGRELATAPGTTPPGCVASVGSLGATSLTSTVWVVCPTSMRASTRAI